MTFFSLNAMTLSSKMYSFIVIFLVPQVLHHTFLICTSKFRSLRQSYYFENQQPLIVKLPVRYEVQTGWPLED